MVLKKIINIWLYTNMYYICMWGYHFNGCFHAGKFEVSRYSNEELRGNGKVYGKMHHVLRKTKGNGYIQSLRAFLYYVKIKTGGGGKSVCWEDKGTVERALQTLCWLFSSKQNEGVNSDPFILGTGTRSRETHSFHNSV